MEQVKIRVIKQNELGRLGDMLYEAIYQPDKNNLIPRTVLGIPGVNTYIKDFGKQKGDHCLVADLDGNIIGAVWTGLSGLLRHFPRKYHRTYSCVHQTVIGPVWDFRDFSCKKKHLEPVNLHRLYLFLSNAMHF